jgi:hypothetical protein
LWTTPDGWSWFEQQAAFNVPMHAIEAGGGRFVAVGDHGALWTSVGGTTWSSVSSTTSNLYRVVWNERAFAANGTGGLPEFAVWGGGGSSFVASADTGAWNTIAENDLEVVTARPGLFLGVREREVLASADGSDWVAQASLPTFGAPAALWDGRQFLILSWGPTPYCHVDPCPPNPFFAVTSEDLSEWLALEQPKLLGRLMPTNGMAFNGHRYVSVVASNPAWTLPPFPRSPVFVSDDGSRWQVIDDVMPYSMAGTSAVTSNGGEFVTVRGGSVLSSPDGVTWTSVDVSPLHLIGVMWTGDEYVAVGDDGAGHAAIAYSADGSQWTSESFPAIPARLLAVAGGQRVQLAVGEAGLTLRRECHPQSPSRRLRGAR